MLLALGVTYLTGWERTDPAFAISGYMLWIARTIASEALMQLLDQELPPDQRQKIKDVICQYAGVRGVHDMRTRYAGDRFFVEFHLEVDGHLTVEKGHAIGDLTEAAVGKLLPGNVEVIAHLEPFGIADGRLDDRVMNTA